MTKIISLKKGLDIKLCGEIQTGQKAREVSHTAIAIVPDDFPGITPKAMVKPGDNVLKGTPLFTDKKYPDIKIVSPISGTVTDVCRGERRKLLFISVEPDEKNNILPEAAKPYKDSDDSEKAQQLLLDSGLWAFMRQVPFGIVPRPSVTPRDIIITTFDSAPLAPSWEEYINTQSDYIQCGASLLKKLTSGNVYLSTRNNETLSAIDNVEVIEFNGPHPAGNPSVQIANIKPVNKGEVVWTLDLPTLVRIGKLAKSNELDFSTEVAITGYEIATPHYVKTTIGASLQPLLEKQLKNSNQHVRIISGNVLTGKLEQLNGWLHYPYTQITVIDEGDDKTEFMGWASLSANKLSENRSFPGYFISRKFCPDARLHGGRRAMIMSGIYDKYLPMDILVEFLIKACIAKDFDQMEQLGIYEILPADVALCEYADPSKLELQKILQEGINLAIAELS